MQTEDGFKAIVMIDAKDTNRQIEEFVESLEARFPDGIPDQISAQLLNLDFGITFAESSSALRADGTVEITQRLRLSDGFERIRAAILADKRNIVHV